jgi:uncharacterized protein (DUF4213/DUF364 family)
MVNPREIYDLLLESAQVQTAIEEIILGLTWTLCRAQGIGLAMSPGTPTRTLPWSGTLVNKSIAELSLWLRSWDSYQATVGMAAINAAINSHSPLIDKAEPIITIRNDASSLSQKSANLAVFEHFRPLIQETCREIRDNNKKRLSRTHGDKQRLSN